MHFCRAPYQQTGILAEQTSSFFVGKAKVNIYLYRQVINYSALNDNFRSTGDSPIFGFEPMISMYLVLKTFEVDVLPFADRQVLQCPHQASSKGLIFYERQKYRVLPSSGQTETVYEIQGQNRLRTRTGAGGDRFTTFIFKGNLFFMQ